MKRFQLIFLLVCAAVFLGLPLSFTSAQEAQQLQVQGLAITPFLIETKVELGQSQQHTVILTNTTNQPLPIEISINDFVPNNSTGQARFLEANETANPAYSLSPWITITQQPAFTIPPNQQTEVAFTITPPLAASPGTHYGGLLFSYRPQIPGSDTVVVRQKVATIVLARLGQGNEQGAITGLLAEPTGAGDNFRFLLTFYNSGNAHLKPKGEIYITNLFGRQVASVPINRDAQIVLPQNERIFESNWQPGWRLGPYKATAVLYYGDPKLEARSNVTIWIVPWTRVALVLCGLIVLIYLLRRFFLYYNRKLLQHANKKS